MLVSLSAWVLCDPRVPIPWLPLWTSQNPGCACPSCVAQCSAHSLSSLSADVELYVLLMSGKGQTQDEARDPLATFWICSNPYITQEKRSSELL